MPTAERSKCQSKAIDAASETPAAMKLTAWMAFTCSFGSIKTISAPARGAQTIKLSISVLQGSARQNQGRGEREGDRRVHQVLLHLPVGHQRAQAEAQIVAQPADAVHRGVDQADV